MKTRKIKKQKSSFTEEETKLYDVAMKIEDFIFKNYRNQKSEKLAKKGVHLGGYITNGIWEILKKECNKINSREKFKKQLLIGKLSEIAGIAKSFEIAEEVSKIKINNKKQKL